MARRHPLADLLPHAPPMILIDDVVGRDDAQLTASVTVRPASPFFVPGRGIAAHVGIEWMAQACGAFVGAEARDQGLPVRIGYLLGTRDFRADMAWFAEGERFEITAALAFREDPMAVFNCRIDRPGSPAPVARAQLTVYQPPEDAVLPSRRDEVRE